MLPVGMNAARRVARHLLPRPPGPSQSSRSFYGRAGVPGFVFDIDGVIRRGAEVLEPAKVAFQKHLFAGGRQRYPFAFLTNGGGMLEAERAAVLSSWLGVPVHASQIVQSHTPMKSLAPALARGGGAVLLAGRGALREVAASYGIQRAVTCDELWSGLPPDATPFTPRPGHAEGAGVTPHAPSTAAAMAGAGAGTEACPIDAVLVMNDPSDWGRDIQLLCDVISSGGVLGRFADDPGSRHVDVYFSNPDLLWANSFPTPRFGQGAFALALSTLFKQAHGRDFQYKAFGKPNREPYQLAEESLAAQAVALGLAGGGVGAPAALTSVFNAIYMIGDNPAADIRGANAAGDPWVSCLVGTGVFRGGRGANDATDPAHIVTDDVLGAVEAGLHHTRKSHWHQHR